MAHYSPGSIITPITQSVEDAVTYPILTQETTPGASRSSGNAPGGAGASSPTRVTQDLLRQILGWRYRSDDTKGFMAALTKTFALTEVEGHTQWTVVPQNYMMQADMGEITGAQASLYARAKAAVDLSTPLLLSLFALRPDADPGDMEAMRSIIGQELPQLVAELGQPAGPRVQRVDSIFKLLIGAHPDYKDPEAVQGHLGQLADRFGLQRRWVNTVEDEQNLTNFLILVDYVNSLFQTWDAQKKYFSRGGKAEPYLGTQLYLVSQALESVLEAVHGAYDAMDSVLIGAAERQTTELRFWQEPYLTAAELLGWAEDFAQNEGKQLLQPDTGKDGVVAFRSTINRISYLVFLAQKVSQAPNSGGLVHGAYTFRVQRSWQELAQYLGLTQTEADRIRRREVDDTGTLSSINESLWLDPSKATSLWTPASASLGPLDGVQITVGGRHIQPGAAMRLISTADPSQGFLGTTNPNSIVPTPGTKGQSMLASFDLSTAPPNTKSVYTIVVINRDGQTAWLEDQFQLDLTGMNAAAETAAAATPVIRSLSPSSVRLSTLRTKNVTVQIRGKNFQNALPPITEWKLGTASGFFDLKAPHGSNDFSDAGNANVSLLIVSDSIAELSLPAGLAKWTNPAALPSLTSGSLDLKVYTSGGGATPVDILADALILKN